MTSLIPREVRARFPGVTTWLPQDAVLTPGDMAAAKAMGVTLRREDDNTIYIPLKDRRPVGTALIFPVVWQKKTFYLLMTTDRQLTVDHVSVLHANALPEAKKLTLYAGFSGKTAAQLPAEEEVAVGAAVVLLVRPEALAGAGFQFSFAAVIAIVTLGGGAQERISGTRAIFRSRSTGGAS